jgi:hypothetical protein
MRDATSGMQVKEPIDIFLSHDWPNGVVPYGNAEQLLQKKPYFRAEVERGDLGSPANWQLLQVRACGFARSGPAKRGLPESASSTVA